MTRRMIAKKFGSPLRLTDSRPTAGRLMSAVTASDFRCRDVRGLLTAALHELFYRPEWWFSAYCRDKQRGMAAERVPMHNVHKMHNEVLSQTTVDESVSLPNRVFAKWRFLLHSAPIACRPLSAAPLKTSAHPFRLLGSILPN